MKGTDLEQKLRALVEEIVMRVLKRKLLIVITGGTIGLDTALEGLKEEETRMDLLFSAAASKIHDKKVIQNKLKADKVFVEGKDRIDNVKDYSGVVFAVLTRNTASKAANLLLDGYVVEVLIDALMLGIPVVAAKDAADIGSQGWNDLGYNWGNENLRHAFCENLLKLQDFGVHVCPSSKLSGIVREVIFGISTNTMDVKTSNNASKTLIDKNPVTRKDIIPYLDTKSEIYIPNNVLITPLAQDIIEDFNLKIIRE